MMQRRGVYFNAADNNRIHGKMQMHYRLRMQDDGRPLLQVFKNCTQFIRTIPMLVYSLTKVEDVDTDCEDHTYDSARYFLMERPISAETPKVVQLPKYNPIA